MLRPDEADIGALIERLTADGVQFIVVGGAAAVIHGAPLPTRDLDVVPELSAENLDRLADTLRALDAIYREPGNRQLPTARRHLDGQGQLLLSTRLGPLDVLLRLHEGETYADLLPDSVERKGGQLVVRVLDLPRLIAIKTVAGRARDRIAVPLLLDLLKEREARANRGD